MTRIKAKDRQMFQNTILNCAKTIKEKIERKKKLHHLRFACLHVLSYRITGRT